VGDFLFFVFLEVGGHFAEPDSRCDIQKRVLDTRKCSPRGPAAPPRKISGGRFPFFRVLGSRGPFWEPGSRCDIQKRTMDTRGWSPRGFEASHPQGRLSTKRAWGKEPATTSKRRACCPGCNLFRIGPDRKVGPALGRVIRRTHAAPPASWGARPAIRSRDLAGRSNIR
jgi:hypothetical protein